MPTFSPKRSVKEADFLSSQRTSQSTRTNLCASNWTASISELNASDESPRIEAKRARELGKSILETVIAFANEPGLGGGHLLLGVDWEVNDKGDTRYRAVSGPGADHLLT